jgi:hypothetical protein
LLRLCRLQKPGTVPSDSDIAAAATVEGAPRQVFNSLRFWRKTGPEQYDEVDRLDGIRQAFGGTVLAPVRAESVPQALPQVPLASPATRPTVPTTAQTVRPNPGRREGPQLG